MVVVGLGTADGRSASSPASRRHPALRGTPAPGPRPPGSRRRAPSTRSSRPSAIAGRRRRHPDDAGRHVRVQRLPPRRARPARGEEPERGRTRRHDHGPPHGPDLGGRRSETVGDVRIVRVPMPQTMAVWTSVVPLSLADATLVGRRMATGDPPAPHRAWLEVGGLPGAAIATVPWALTTSSISARASAIRPRPAARTSTGSSAGGWVVLSAWVDPPRDRRTGRRRLSRTRPDRARSRGPGRSRRGRSPGLRQPRDLPRLRLECPPPTVLK